MSGHSKWSNIKRKKEITDSKKSKAFTKVSRLITIAVRQGGGDAAANPSLRLALEKARQARMPKVNIQRAVQKGLGVSGGAAFSEVTYEGFGPFGVALIICAITNNTNRTVAEIKTLLGKSGGSLGAPGSTAYIFDTVTRAPTFTIELSSDDLSSVESLKDRLVAHEDIQQVFSNEASNS